MKFERWAAGCVAAGLVALPAHGVWAQADKAPVAQEAPVHQDALDALSRMSSYLRELPAFQLSGDTVREQVEGDGRKLQLLGTTTYKVRRPNGFDIEITEDRQVRRVVYDGKALTVFSPRMGYYATVAAPATIREVLDVAADKYDIVLPLEDLFIWGTDDDWRSDLLAGYYVGYARVAGQDADQYAFEQDGIDWQIWIARGDKPLPLRIVITSIADPERPQFQSSLNWNVAPQFTATDFVFSPPAGASPIVITAASH